ncbi:MAG: hypothetical protein ACI3VR_15200 [Intestinibacter sp.]|uniref:hypothetical protein n=1 Tax=Intestinibacter sp. TaxID=1965304 RepID=UPI003F18B2B1
MYETLYEFTKTECYLKSVGAGIIEVALWIFILFIVIRNYFKSKKELQDEKTDFNEVKNDDEYKEIRLATIIVIIATPIIMAFILSMRKDNFISYNYLYNEYKNGNCYTVEGEVENYKVYYVGRDEDIRVIEFDVDGVSFIIDRDYEVYDEIRDNCAVKHNGQKLRITYMLEKDLDLDKYYMIVFNDKTHNGIVKIEEKIK